MELSSHQIEIEGTRYIERMIGQTVNASTVSRKWRLLKVLNKEYELTPLMFDLPCVVVEELKAKTRSTEGRWRVVSINGTSVEKIHKAAQQQLELFD
jgi:hypothetical protein